MTIEERLMELRANIEALARDAERHPNIPTTAATFRYLLETDAANSDASDDDLAVVEDHIRGELAKEADSIRRRTGRPLKG